MFKIDTLFYAPVSDVESNALVTREKKKTTTKNNVQINTHDRSVNTKLNQCIVEFIKV